MRRNKRFAVPGSVKWRKWWDGMREVLHEHPNNMKAFREFRKRHDRHLRLRMKK